MTTGKQPSPTASAARAKRRAKLWLATAAAVLAVAAGVWLAFRGGTSPSLSPEAYRQLIVDRDLALAQIEALQTADADALLQSIAERLPDELFPAHNLAICRLLAAERSEAPDLPSTRSAVERLLERAPESAAPLWLAARLVQLERGDSFSIEHDRQAVELLRRAADLDPQDVRVRFALHTIASSSTDPALLRLAEQAIEEAFAVEPENVHLLTLWLAQQAKREDPSIVSTLEAARKTVVPYESLVLREARVSIVDLLDKALAAARAPNWRQVQLFVAQFRNVVLFPEVTKRDLARLDAHPLDLLIRDYSPRFQQQAPPPLPATPPIAIAFQAFPDDEQPRASFQAAVRRVEILDFDQDGRLELATLESAAVRILTRDADSPWREVVAAETPAGLRGMLWADLDRDRAGRTGLESGRRSGVEEEEDESTASAGCHDADVDLVVYGDAGVQVFRNELLESGARQMTRVPQSEPFDALRRVTSAALVDVDHDADLDLVVASETGLSIWSSLGESMTFEDISDWSLLPKTVEVTSIVAVDWDRDVDIDLMLADASGQLVGMLENLRHARFAWKPFDAPWEALQGASHLAVVESDGNASWDLVGAGSSGIHLMQSATPRPGRVEFLRAVAVRDEAAGQIATLDYDNDGYQDLICWTAEQLQWYRGAEGGALALDDRLRAAVSGLADCGSGDIDGDGDLDLALATDHGVELLRNDGGSQNHWLEIRAVGRIDNRGRANHTGIGSLLELTDSGHFQAQVITGQTTHFGLGAERQATAARIVWTNGVPQVIVEPPADLRICERMTLKGSCPYIYTWTGERFEFFTDCLWAAPIGLQVADGVPAPSRHWEYLRLPGERLQPRDGEYWLQFTEELWEAAYFDQIELLVVDHPADVEIYSNEKVGPPSIAEFKIHTVREPLRPVAARDQRGRDVLPQLAQRDGDFVRAFDARLWQGLTEEHYLELDLGELQDPRAVTLFLTGWIYPTDTSLNIAFSQSPEVDGPRLPAVWTPDEKGEWREAIAYMGFPGGKTKTIAVDLSQAFSARDYRVRIVTTAEIYWDEAFFTVDESPAPSAVTRLSPTAAELHERGYSRRLPGIGFGPERYDYELVSTMPLWPPMEGHFTRLGDVLPLLEATDARMAVLGAGDEMTVRFPAPPPPREGWKRDFILHCVGWDKDADLNTYFGQSSEPLPFAEMKSYPYAADESFPDTREHREYLRTYQTRQQNPAAFWRAIKDYVP